VIGHRLPRDESVFHGGPAFSLLTAIYHIIQAGMFSACTENTAVPVIALHGSPLEVMCSRFVGTTLYDETTSERRAKQTAVRIRIHNKTRSD